MKSYLNKNITILVFVFILVLSASFVYGVTSTFNCEDDAYFPATCTHSSVFGGNTDPKVVSLNGGKCNTCSEGETVSITVTDSSASNTCPNNDWSGVHWNINYVECCNMNDCSGEGECYDCDTSTHTCKNMCDNPGPCQTSEVTSCFNTPFGWSCNYKNKDDGSPCTGESGVCFKGKCLKSVRVSRTDPCYDKYTYGCPYATYSVQTNPPIKGLTVWKYRKKDSVEEFNGKKMAVKTDSFGKAKTTCTHSDDWPLSGSTTHCIEYGDIISDKGEKTVGTYGYHYTNEYVKVGTTLENAVQSSNSLSFYVCAPTCLNKSDCCNGRTSGTVSNGCWTTYDCSSGTLSCLDSDLGRDYYRRGDCQDPLHHVDYCYNDNVRLKEYFCSSGHCISATYNCPNGCSNGACIPGCSDSDGGKDYFTKGTCSDSLGSSVTDYCYSNGVSLEEYYCEGNSCKGEIHQCPNGCSDGACINANPSGNGYWEDLSGNSISAFTLVQYGDKVKLVLDTSGLPQGTQVNFQIYEEDSLAFDDNIRTGADSLHGVIDSNGRAETEWQITEEDLNNAGDEDSYDFYFKADASGLPGQVRSSILTVTPSIVSCNNGIYFCSDYSDMDQCNQDPCSVAKNSVNQMSNESLVCGSTYFDTQNCLHNVGCYCEWKNEKCNAKWDDSLDDTSCSSVNGIGTCVYSSDSNDDCSDGFLEFNWTADWEWDSSNIFDSNPDGDDYIYDSNDGKWHYDPLRLFELCKSGGQTIPCPTQIKVPFFGILQLIIAILVIGAIYFISKNPLAKTQNKKRLKKH